MKLQLRRLIGAIIVAWSLAGGSSIAQMSYMARSLEWLVVDSDVAVRASVASVDRTRVVYGDDRLQGNPEVWNTVTLLVHETLKGQPAGSLTFVERALDSNRIYETWRDAGHEQLWFLVRTKPKGDGDGATAENLATHHHFTNRGIVSLGALVLEERDLKSVHSAIFSLNLNILRESNEILNAARAAVAEGGERKQVKEHAIRLPRSVMQRSGRSGDVNHLTVPIDRRLEKLGHRLIEAPGVFLANDELVEADWLRLEGVKILRHFPTAEHTVLLKALLDDQMSTVQVGPGETREKVYYIREAAYEALKLWSIDVVKPVLREAPPEP